MFQEPALFPWLDVLGNVLFGLKLKPGLTKRRRGARSRMLPAAGRARGLRARQHPRALGRHEAARGAGPRAGARSRACCSWTSRSRRSTRMTREQLYGDLQRIWAAAQQDDRLRHPQRARGGLPRRPRDPVLAAPGPHPRGVRHSPCRGRATSTAPSSRSYAARDHRALKRTDRRPERRPP